MEAESEALFDEGAVPEAHAPSKSAAITAATNTAVRKPLFVMLSIV